MHFGVCRGSFINQCHHASCDIGPVRSLLIQLQLSEKITSCGGLFLTVFFYLLVKYVSSIFLPLTPAPIQANDAVPHLLMTVLLTAAFQAVAAAARSSAGARADDLKP